MTLELQLKHYITNLFNLPRKENGNVNLSKKSLIISFRSYVRLGPLTNKILQTYTYYSDTLHERHIYPFILYYQKQLIAIGYIDETNDMDFLYLHNTVIPLLIKDTYLKRRIIIMNKWIHIAQISVTVITEVITIMKDIEKEK